MIHYVDTNKCNFCKNAPETLQHLFYDCHKVKNIWKALQEWIFKKLKMGILLNKHIVMFGKINGEINQLYAVNWLIINIKYHIYCTKIFGNNLDITSIKNTLQHKYQIEKYIYYKNCEYDKFKSTGENGFTFLIIYKIESCILYPYILICKISQLVLKLK